MFYYFLDFIIQSSFPIESLVESLFPTVVRTNEFITLHIFISNIQFVLALQMKCEKSFTEDHRRDLQEAFSIVKRLYRKFI